MMTETQQREYLDAVDEMRRLQIVTRRPPDAHARKNIATAEQLVDQLTLRYRTPDTPATTLHTEVTSAKV